jgi:DUF4097 and DUF4098 domain-containing protein YvlB
MRLIKPKSAILFILICFVSVPLYAQSLELLHDKNFDVSTGELFELEASNGDVNIESWDKNSLSIKVYGNSKAEDKIEFTFEKTGKGVYAKAVKEGSSWFSWMSGIKLRFDVKVPKSFDIDARTSGGNINLFDLEGKLILKTSGGDVKLKNTSGDLTAKTSGGNITAENHTGNAFLKTSGGDIVSHNFLGDIDAGTSGGNIKLNVKEGKISAGTSGGDVELFYSGKNKGIKLGTSGGDIVVNLPKDFAADVLCKTSGGDVEVDFPSQSSTKIKSGRFEGKINNGGEMLECKTSGGDITVKSI